MKIKKLSIIFLSISILISGCASLQENMAGSKRSNKSDEFLIHKKKPLVLPPDYDDLPLPRAEANNNKKIKKDNSLKGLLDVYEDDQDKTSKSEDGDELENSILKKIKNN